MAKLDPKRVHRHLGNFSVVPNPNLIEGLFVVDFVGLIENYQLESMCLPQGPFYLVP